MADGPEQEDFGEAELGEAQADNPPADPEMLEGAEGAGPPEDGEAEVPAIPPSRDRTVEEQAEEAAAEAARIGGESPSADLPEEEAPVIEAGGGEAEGFEQAEELLRENASHGDGRGDPIADRPTPEEREAEGHTIYGEPDQARKPDRPEEPGPDEPG